MIGLLEGDESSVALVYSFFGDMYHRFHHKPVIQAMVSKRWTFMSSACSGIAYMLTPNHSVDGYHKDNDSLNILGQVNKFTEARFPGKGDEAEKEMGLFVTSMTTLTDAHRESVFKMNGKVYWNVIGRHKFPTLYLAAKGINEMICSSAASERVWSVYRFIHSRLRSQLGNDKVEKLAFLYVNCAMIDDIDKMDYLEAEGVLLSGVDCFSDDEN